MDPIYEALFWSLHLYDYRDIYKLIKVHCYADVARNSDCCWAAEDRDFMYKEPDVSIWRSSSTVNKKKNKKNPLIKPPLFTTDKDLQIEMSGSLYAMESSTTITINFQEYWVKSIADLR